ncbi:MAG: extracellular solute-binding protein [Betaproteobacteria bacterium]
MRRREFVKGALAAASATALGGVLPASAQAKPEKIVVMTWGGNNADGVEKGIDKPYFDRYGVKVVLDTGSSPVERITKLKLSLNDQPYDVLNLGDAQFPLAIKQGVLETLALSSPNLANLKDVYPRMVRPHWVTCYFSAVGITYNRAIKNPPTSWADLWRPEFKGRIVIPDVTHTIGLYPVVIGAMAEGKSPKDADAGFAMLKRLADLQPIIAKDTDTIMNNLQSGDAQIGLLYKSQTYTIQDKGAEVEWVFPKEGGIEISWGYGIAKNSKNREWAERWINLAMDPDVQPYFTEWGNYPGSNPKMLAKLSPKLKQRAFFTDDQLKRMVVLDQEYMSDRRAEWTDRWNRIMVR